MAICSNSGQKAGLVLGVRNRVSSTYLWQFAAILGRNRVSGAIATGFS
ncbi:hypothetical protein [Laspinema olomoucense]|nr:hypothetical protein [Laspinema sp. D3a]MCT7986837.1 hypothetical protein [Laspinema sp. D3a]